MHKVLFFLKTPPPITGATLMNERVCNSELFQNKYNINIIHLNYAKDTSSLGKNKVAKSFKFIKYFFILFWHLIFFRPHLIYFQISTVGFSFFRDSFYVLLMKLFRRKILFHLRSKGIRKYIEGKKLHTKYYRFLFKNTYVICLSELLTYDISTIYKGKPYIVYNGMPVFNYKRRGMKHNQVNILFLSNLFIEKGIYCFIDALHLLAKRDIEFCATIVGEEADVTQEELQKYINSKNLDDRVSYLGPKYNEDKFEEYCMADIFVFPTYYQAETWGGVLLEAMQFGLPVISTFEASIPIIVEDNISGLLIESKNPRLLAEKMELLIVNPEIRREMGIKGKERFYANFTFDKFEKNLQEVFDDILN